VASPRPRRATPASAPAAPKASRINLTGSVRDVCDYFYQQGWTDGLPIIPPTEDLVLEMLEASPLSAGQVLGQVPPLNGSVTVEKTAINAVMAGCRPEYFPVVLAAVKAVLQPQFNVGGITTTTGGAAPVALVSGPLAAQLDINSGTAVFGSGHQANATIGRALRLTLRNLGGAVAATMEKSTHGWPGKYTMCFAESAERCPWEPLQVALGYPKEATIVLVSACRGIHTLVESTQESGQGVLETLVGSMTAGGISGYAFQARGASPIIVFGPEHAAEVAAAGYSRQDVAQYLFERVRLPKSQIKGRGHYGARSWPAEFEAAPDDTMLPLVADPGKYVITVAGGDGRHSSWFPAWSATQRAVEVVQG